VRAPRATCRTGRTTREARSRRPFRRLSGPYSRERCAVWLFEREYPAWFERPWLSRHPENLRFSETATASALRAFNRRCRVRLHLLSLLSQLASAPRAFTSRCEARSIRSSGSVPRAFIGSCEQCYCSPPSGERGTDVDREVPQST